LLPRYLFLRTLLLAFFLPRRLIDVQQSQEALLPITGPELSSDHVFERLFLEHYPRLVKTLLRLVGNPGQAEELAADAFYRLHEHRDRQHWNQQGPDENPAGWLYRTAMNLGLDALRSNARRSRREEKAYREGATGETAGNPLYELLAEEQRERVRTVISHLKPVQGQVLLMGSSGFTCKEIAAVLGVKPDSLYVLISRARMQFEREYVKLYGREE
jgi:RNA polymerase sigma-70 factor (ECF subfamily)